MRLYESIVCTLTYLFLMYPKEPLWPRWFPEQAVANAFAVLFVLNAIADEADVAKGTAGGVCWYGSMDPLSLPMMQRVL
jgi:hypothetical protein